MQEQQKEQSTQPKEVVIMPGVKELRARLQRLEDLRMRLEREKLLAQPAGLPENPKK